MAVQEKLLGDAPIGFEFYLAYFTSLASYLAALVDTPIDFEFCSNDYIDFEFCSNDYKF